MSVALDDQGEMVPGRGTTSTSRTLWLVPREARAVAQQALKDDAFPFAQIAVQVGEMQMLRVGPDGPTKVLAEPRLQLAQTEIRERGVAAKDKHCVRSQRAWS